MNSTPTPKPSDDPHDVVVVAPDAVRVVPAEQEISDLLRGAAARHQSDPQTRAGSSSTSAPPVPPVDTTFRPADVSGIAGSGQRRSVGRRAVRTFVALLLAACIGAAAIAWQAFGYAGKKLMVKWTPQFVMTTLPLEKWGLTAQPASPANEEADAANTDSPQAAPVAQSAAEAAAPAAVAPSAAGPAPSLQSMARDLASMTQEVAQLRASIAELKANQQQISRDLAKAAENKATDTKATENKAVDPNARAKLALAPPRPAVARPRKPAPPLPPAQAAIAPLLPPAIAPNAPRQPEALPPAAAQLPPEPGFTSTPRPPMPVQ